VRLLTFVTVILLPVVGFVIVTGFAPEDVDVDLAAAVDADFAAFAALVDATAAATDFAIFLG